MNKIIKTLSTWGAGAFLLVSSTQLNAAFVPAFGLNPVSPTAMLLPTNSSATVQYQVINQTPLTRTLTIKPITGISQTTSGSGICSSPFTLAPQQSCLLTLQVNGSQIPSRVVGGPEVCKTQGPGNNNPDPFLCSQPATADQLAISSTAAIPDQQAYVTNWNANSISLCDVSTFDGSLNNCTITASGAPFVNPEAIGLSPDGSFLYVASINALNMANATVAYCQVESTGALSGCTATGSGFNGADGVAINPAGTLAYVSNAGNSTVSFCQVDGSGILGNCTLTGNGLHVPSDMTLNAAGTIAYVSDLANSVSVCPIDETTGALTCTRTILGFNEPEGITLHPTGQFAYITNNGDNSISVCKIDAITGYLFSCGTTNGQFDGFGNLAFNNLGTRAYIPRSAISRVSVCSVNLKNGALSECRDSNGSGFSQPSGILLK